MMLEMVFIFCKFLLVFCEINSIYQHLTWAKNSIFHEKFLINGNLVNYEHTQCLMEQNRTELKILVCQTSLDTRATL